MRTFRNLILYSAIAALAVSCVSKKKYSALESNFVLCDAELKAIKQAQTECDEKLLDAQYENTRLSSDLKILDNRISEKNDRIDDLKAQLEDFRGLRDAQLGQVESLTELSQTANKNIDKTLAQLEERDRYIKYLQAAKNKTDSMNLALSANLTTVLKDGIADDDIDIKVDKAVVMINLSDKMLFKSGSSTVTSRANEVLGKIAEIIKSRPGFDVMVEGYTDSIPISNKCVKDNWELSVKRATSVVKVLQQDHAIDPARLIASGRGEHQPVADNSTPEGRSANRRTRIIIMPGLDQFYDLLDPEQAPGNEEESEP